MINIMSFVYLIKSFTYFELPNILRGIVKLKLHVYVIQSLATANNKHLATQMSRAILT